VRFIAAARDALRARSERCSGVRLAADFFPPCLPNLRAISQIDDAGETTATAGLSQRSSSSGGARERFVKVFWKQKGTIRRPLCYVLMFRVTELEAETKFALWKTPQIPLEIEYALKVMDEILAAACAALGELPVGEREVGGVLFGEHQERSIRIKTWRPIVCQHTDGPTLAPRIRVTLAPLKSSSPKPLARTKSDSPPR
jgi:hypothetical protein